MKGMREEKDRERKEIKEGEEERIERDGKEE